MPDKTESTRAHRRAGNVPPNESEGGVRESTGVRDVAAPASYAQASLHARFAESVNNSKAAYTVVHLLSAEGRDVVYHTLCLRTSVASRRSGGRERFINKVSVSHQRLYNYLSCMAFINSMVYQTLYK